MCTGLEIKKKKVSNWEIFTGIIFSETTQFLEYELFSYGEKKKTLPKMVYILLLLYLAFIQDFQDCLGSHLFQSWQTGFQAPQWASDMLQKDLKGVPSQLLLNWVWEFPFHKRFEFHSISE